MLEVRLKKSLPGFNLDVAFTVDRETLEWGLRELRPSELLEKYFPRLVEKPEHAHLLNILHLVYSLEGQLDFQIQEYGLDSVKDDLQEINASLQQVAKGPQREFDEFVKLGAGVVTR